MQLEANPSSVCRPTYMHWEANPSSGCRPTTMHWEANPSSGLSSLSVHWEANPSLGLSSLSKGISPIANIPTHLINKHLFQRVGFPQRENHPKAAVWEANPSSGCLPFPKKFLPLLIFPLILSTSIFLKGWASLKGKTTQKQQYGMPTAPKNISACEGASR